MTRRLHKSSLSLIGRQQKIELLYAYFAGPQFRSRMEAAAEAFVANQEDLNAEKRAMHRIWKKREKHHQTGLVNLASIYGEVQAIIGATVPELAAFSLAVLTEATLEEEEEEDPEAV
jgi:hypothetical protein